VLTDEGGNVSMSTRSVKLAGVAAAACVFAALGLPGALAYTKPGAIRITDVETSHTYVDEGVHGRGPGDVDIYRSRLYNRRITAKALGRADMVCTTISGTAQQCDATYFLPRGQLITSGVIQSRLIYILAVTGGTDYYNNARGTLTVTSLHRTPTRELLLFRLVL
jgi:hypothetical protein